MKVCLVLQIPEIENLSNKEKESIANAFKFIFPSALAIHIYQDNINPMLVTENEQIPLV